ncbi:hypothetical protein ACQJBY_036173 [Aegilops geniculata]
MEAREDVSSRNGGVEAFLASCTVSGDDTYDAARAVLERLQAPATRAEARRHLSPPRRRPRRRAGGTLPRLQPPHPRRRPTRSAPHPPHCPTMPPLPPVSPPSTV